MSNESIVQDALRKIEQEDYKRACGELRPLLEEYLIHLCANNTNVTPRSNGISDMIHALYNAQIIDDISMSKFLAWNKFGNAGSHFNKKKVSEDDAMYFLQGISKLLKIPKTIPPPLDTQSTDPVSPKPLEAAPEKFAKINRIKRWANHPEQDNHKIIMAYLQLEKDGNVRLDDFRKCCLNKSGKYYVPTFNGHYASMKTDAGNSHGNVFYDKDGIVSIWQRVREEIKLQFEN